MHFRCLVLSYGTGVKKSLSYEVLVTGNQDLIDWIPSESGNVPPNSVIGGLDCSYLEPLYVGRTRGSLNVGRTWRGQRLEVLPHEVNICRFFEIFVAFFDKKRFQILIKQCG